MTKRVSARLQTSNLTASILTNDNAPPKLNSNSTSPSQPMSKTTSDQNQKGKRVYKQSKGEGMNKLFAKSDKNGGNTPNHKPKSNFSSKTNHVLQGGLHISINDHVYLSQSDSSAPHIIGRIMKFVKDSQGLHVKVAFYYRQRDLAALILSEKEEPRRLIASMYSEKFSVKFIQGKCTVIHTNYINDLNKFSELDDHFYFDEFFDKYSLISFKLLPTEKISNMPTKYRLILRDKYQFIATEPNQMEEYIREYQECPFCNNWCSEHEGIECSSCKKKFHRRCMATPIKNKPRKGYVFECSTCVESNRIKLEQLKEQNSLDDRKSTKSDHSDRLSEKYNDTTNREKSHIHTPNPNLDGQPINKENDKNQIYSNPPLRCSDEWMFRYFGKHSYFEDLDDPHDSIYPRAGNRVGSKYQATIPELLTATSPQEHTPKSQNQHTKRKSKKLKYIPLNCSDPIFYIKSEIHDNKVQKTMEMVRNDDTGFAAPVVSNALLNKAILLMDNDDFDPEQVFNQLKNMSIIDLQKYEPFTDEEQIIFEKALCTYAEDIESIAKKLPNRPLPQIVEYFYKWASKTVGNKAKSTANKSKMRSMAKVITHGLEPLGIDEGRDYNRLVKTRSSARANSACAHCQSKLEKLTYQLHPDIMDDLKISGDICSKCYLHWTKYYQLPEINEETIRLNKENATKPLVIIKKKSNDHEHLTTKDIKDKVLMTKLSSSERSKKLKESLVKSRFDPNLLSEGISLPPLGCCALNNVLSKALKKIDEFTLSPNILPTPVVLSPNLNSNIDANQSPEELKSDSKTHPSIILKFSIPSACNVCHSKQSLEQMVKCRTCKMSVHKTCYLLPTNFDHTQNWHCQQCLNKSDVNYYQNYSCVLCRKFNSDDSSHFPVKPTIAGNWAHMICSIFLPSIYFTSFNNQYKVDGFSEIDIDEWKTKCSICNKDNSLCSNCKGCGTKFHVTCASEKNYTLGFNIPSLNFNETLDPVIYCTNCKHSDKEAKFIPLSDLSTYDSNELYQKCLNPRAHSHQPINSNLYFPQPSTSQNSSDMKLILPHGISNHDPKNSNTAIFDHSITECSKCGRNASPFWWTNPDSIGQYLCQSCNFDLIASKPAVPSKRKIILRVKPDEEISDTPTQHRRMKTKK